MGMGVSQQPMPEHADAAAPPFPAGELVTTPVHLSLMEQKEEQPLMTLPPPPSPTSVACTLHPVTTNWLCLSDTTYGPAPAPPHVPLPSSPPSKARLTCPALSTTR